MIKVLDTICFLVVIVMAVALMGSLIMMEVDVERCYFYSSTSRYYSILFALSIFYVAGRFMYLNERNQ